MPQGRSKVHLPRSVTLLLPLFERSSCLRCIILIIFLSAKSQRLMPHPRRPSPALAWASPSLKLRRWGNVVSRRVCTAVFMFSFVYVFYFSGEGEKDGRAWWPNPSKEGIDWHILIEAKGNNSLGWRRTGPAIIRMTQTKQRQLLHRGHQVISFRVLNINLKHCIYIVYTLYIYMIYPFKYINQNGTLINR